jgi:diacylglycerol kinase
MKKTNKHQSWRDTFGHAIDGCRWAFGTQKNFKVHFSLSALALILAVWLAIPFSHFLLIVLAIAWGLTIEMANTAIEKVVDLLTEKYHLKAKIAKDVAAGMMLVLSVGLAILGLLILLPPLINRIAGLL